MRTLAELPKEARDSLVIGQDLELPDSQARYAKYRSKIYAK
jgi:hypothetical protein